MLRGNLATCQLDAWAENAVKVDPKPSDKNGREKQTKERWEWNKRHSKYVIEQVNVNKNESRDKALWWGKKHKWKLITFYKATNILFVWSAMVYGDWTVCVIEKLGGGGWRKALKGSV